jgi:hypothetical protein
MCYTEGARYADVRIVVATVLALLKMLMLNELLPGLAASSRSISI